MNRFTPSELEWTALGFSIPKDENMEESGRGDTVRAPNWHRRRVHPGTVDADACRVTAVVNWRGDARRVHQHLPLPEPPRTRHVSKASREPKDRTTRALEEWLSDLAVARTIDAD